MQFRYVTIVYNALRSTVDLSDLGRLNVKKLLNFNVKRYVTILYNAGQKVSKAL